MDISQSWEFIKHNWIWLLVAYPLCCVVGYYIWYRLVDRRIYKEIDGKLYVKHGIGAWLELPEHLETNHPASVASMKEETK